MVIFRCFAQIFCMKYTLTGLAFAMLWASASTITKMGLHSAQSLVISDVRFFIAGALMLAGAHILRGYRLPTKSEWLPLALYGFMNVTLYLGLFAIAIMYVAAGIGTLLIAINPLIISILSAFWLKKSISKNVWLGLFLGMLGVTIATYPLLLNSYATPSGMFILLMAMLSYSVGTVYYSSKNWSLPILAINGWQVLFGGFFLIPFTLFTLDMSKNHFDGLFWGTVLWLVVGVSFGAVQLWLYLLKIDPVKASMWLFLCPIFGFIYAAILLNEPISVYTVIGTALVILGLYIGQRKIKTIEV
jgi:probable blue pigment (indigoidine) exporter